MTETWGLTEKIWKVIGEHAEQMKKQYPALVFRDDKKEEFDREFQRRYKETMSRFMTDSTKELDSHKQAAVIIICCLKTGVIEYPEDQLENEMDLQTVPLIPQIIAVSTGLSFMQDYLAERLRGKKISTVVEQYYFPVPFACNTPYGNSMCRILYYEQHKRYGMDFNVLELADRLYLLEYINLLQYGIEPTLLKEKK